jgi:hypothetical protein
MTIPVSAVQTDGMVPSKTKEDEMKAAGNILAIVLFSAAVLVGTATAQTTPLGLKAWGERLQGEARVYQQPPPRTVRLSAGHFDWSDAGIGALLGFALTISFIGALLLLGRRFRRTQFATL